MREKLLEKNLKKPLTDAVRIKIEKRLCQLRKDFAKFGQVEYGWNKEKNILYAKTVNISWIVAFTPDKKVTIWADVPFFIIPFAQPYKAEAVRVIKEELKELLK